MKKSLILIFVIIFINNANAQKLSYGISTGALMSWKCIENRGAYSDQKNMYSIPIGLHLNYEINKNFSLEMQLRYANEGANMYHSYPSIIGEEPANFTIHSIHNYLRVPLNFHYTYSHASLPFKIGIFAGPSVGYLINQNWKATAQNDAGQDLINRMDFADYGVKKWDFGLNAGVRLSKNISSSTLVFLDFGYYKGLTNIYDESYNTNKYNNNHMIANIGLLHRF